MNKDKTLKLVRKIVESYIDPSSNTKDQEFYVNKLEEQFTVTWIKTKFLPAYIKHFNEVYRDTWTRAIIHNTGVESDNERWKGRFSKPIEDSVDLIRNLKKIRDDTEGWLGMRSLIYFTKSSNGAEFLFKIEKSSPHIVRVNFLNPWKEGYMGYELEPGGYPADKFSFGKVEENKSTEYNPVYNISKEEEGYGFEFIKRNRVPVVVDSFNEFTPSDEVTEMEIRRNIQKVEHEKNDGISDKIVYRSIVRGNTFYFDLRKTWGGRMLAGASSPLGGSIRDVYVQNGGIQFHDISENIQPKDVLTKLKEHRTNPNFTITKEEEGRGFEFIKKILIDQCVKVANNGMYPDISVEEVRKSLKKTKHTEGVEFYYSDWIDFTAQVKIYILNFFLRKGDRGQLIAGFKDPHNRWTPTMYYIATGKKVTLNENVRPNLSISKLEEDYAFSRLKLLKNNQGEFIGKYLKKINHIRSDNPYHSDQIKYLNTDNNTTFTVVKNLEGKLGFCAGFTASKSATGVLSGTDYVAHVIEPLNENAPSGDWQGWETITQPEKDRLKVVLKQYQDYIKSIYHPNLSSQKLYIIQKCIDNLDVTDPRLSAKPLAQLPMEMRLSMMGFVDHKDTTGQASKVMDFLMDISRNYIEPPKPPKSDIELKGITDIVWPNGRSLGNVYIHGIEDMRPVINFGYGPYILDDRFISHFSKPGSQLYLDSGQGIKIVNMSQVMSRVKDAMEKYKKSLNESSFTDSEQYKEATRRMIVLHNFTKQEEEFIFQILKNKIVDGERLGKTLKKTYHFITKNPFDYARMDFTATIKGKEKIYRVVKTKDHKRVVVRDASMGGDFKNCVIPLNENLSKRVVLSKEDEGRAVQFISNLIYGGQRLGKTLKKENIYKSDNPLRSEKTVVYSAKLEGPNNIKIEFEIFRSWRRGLIAIDTTNYVTHVIDDPGLV